MIHIPGFWLFPLGALILLLLMLYALRFRNTATGRAFLYLILCAFVWVFFFVLETTSSTLEWKFFFARLQFLGITFLPLAWLYLVFIYTGQRRTWHDWLLLAILPLATNLVIWTNPLHHWFYGNPQIELESAPFPVMIADYQFWFYNIHAPGGYLYVLAALIILLSALMKVQTVYRYQSWLLLLAILAPTITDVLYVLGFSPIKHFNYTTAVFSFSGVILAWSLFRHRFLDLLPLARDSVIDSMSDGIIVLDLKYRIVDINPAARYITGLATSISGQKIQDVDIKLAQTIDDLIQQNLSLTDIEISASEAIHYEIKLTSIHDQLDQPLGWVVTLHDISDRVRLLKQMQSLAIHDSLTGIFNRRHFTELCQRELLRLRRETDYSFSLLMIDLDHFKDINDTYGHVIGDQVLVAFVDTIQKHLRAVDLFARIGGEEFVVLLTGSEETKAIRVAKRLQEAVEKIRVPLHQEKLTFTASFGVVTVHSLTSGQWEIDQLLDMADQALYQAKKGGRNQVKVWQASADG